MQASTVDTPTAGHCGTIFVAIDLSQKTWLVTLHSPDRDRISRRTLEGGDDAGLLALLEGVRTRVVGKLGTVPRVVTCYEAGPLGFTLHRQLSARGVTNYVVRPRVWDEHRGRVKTDGRDALWMLNALDRFCAGNKKALALVRVPTEEEERKRSHSRLRQSLARDRQVIAQRGRGIALQYGFRLKGAWFGRRSWPRWQEALPPWLINLLEPLRAACLFLHDQLRAQDEVIEKSSTVPLPKGLGRLSEQILQREACDWHRFQNRRQVSSYLGLCPSENSSGARQQQGHITKAGNPRLRWALCEAAWRLLRHQPEYRGVKKWRERLGSRASAAQKKQALVALARTFGVDWWRLCTGRTTPEKLGLVMPPTASASVE